MPTFIYITGAIVLILATAVVFAPIILSGRISDEEEKRDNHGKRK